MNSHRAIVGFPFRVFRSPLRLAVAFYFAVAACLAVALSYKPRLEFPHPHEAFAALGGFTPDGRFLCSCPAISHLATFDIIEEEIRKPFVLWNVDGIRIPAPQVVAGSQSAWSARIFYDGNQSERLNLFWDLLLSQSPLSRVGELNGVFARGVAGKNEITVGGSTLGLSKDNQFLTIHAWLENRDDAARLLIVRAATGECVFDQPGTAFSFDSDSRPRIVSTALVQSDPLRAVVRRLEVESGRELSCIQLEVESVGPHEFSPDGRWFSMETHDSVSDIRVVRIWNAVTGRLHLSIREPFITVFTNRNTSFAAVHDADDSHPSRIDFWEVASGRLVGTWLASADSRDWPRIHAVSSDGQVVAVSEHKSDSFENWPWIGKQLSRIGVPAGNDVSDTVFIDATEGKELARLGRGPRNFIGGLYEPRIAFSDDGKRLAVVGADEIIRVWDLPLRRSWSLIACLSLIPAAPLLLFAAWRRFRAPKSAAVGV